MNDFLRGAQVFALTWAALAPLWLLTVAALVWGRIYLSRGEVFKGLAWTLGASVTAFPVAWGILGYFAGFNPQPRSSRMEIGGRFAGLLFPLYSAVIACVVFGLRIEAARKNGAPPRPTVVRVICGLVLAITVGLAMLGLLVGVAFSPGPKVFG
jgi:hypothetical protein